MKLRIALPFLVIVLCLAACSGGTRGWPQSVKDTVIDSCIRQAKAGGAALEEAKIRSYCSCYQQNVEKSIPNSQDLAQAKVEVLAKASQPCLEAVLK
jgi:hypothetical protein